MSIEIGVGDVTGRVPETRVKYKVEIVAIDRQESIWHCEDFELAEENLSLRAPQRDDGRGFGAINFPVCNMISWAVSVIQSEASADEPA